VVTGQGAIAVGPRCSDELARPNCWPRRLWSGRDGSDLRAKVERQMNEDMYRQLPSCYIMQGFC
jgi:hypothetical protein